MKIVLYILAAPLLLAALTFAAGWLLPATREGQAATVIAAPPAAVLAVIRDVAAQPGWRAGITRVTPTPDGWVEETPRERITFTTDAMTETGIRLRFASDAGYTGTWQATLAPVAGGTRITATERATVPSPLGRILSRLLFDPGDVAATYLAALKARVEG